MGADYPYLYPWSVEDAEQLGELDRWRESHRRNVACALAIEEAIRKGFDGMHLDADCAKSVLEKYGFLRVNYVLANTLQEKDSDGRFSQRNRLWARGISVPPDQHHNMAFVVESHPTVLDGFLDQVRQAYQSLGLFGPEHCAGDRDELDYTGKVLALRLDSLKESCWDPRNQLWLGECGFGCTPHARGRAVYATCLGDGEKARWERSDFAGVLDEQYLPDWAQEKLLELRAQQEQTGAPAAGGMTME